MAYKIGQYFKSNDYKNTQDNQNRPGEQSLQHLMTHAILGAATSYATGQDIGIGALSSVMRQLTDKEKKTLQDLGILR